MLTNANFIYGSEVFRAATGLRPEDRHIISLPLFHAAAQCHALWPSLVTGCSVALMSRFSASRFFEQAVKYDATMAALFGAPLRMLLNQPPGSADSAHAIRNITFAQSLTAEQYDEWHRRFDAPLQQLWGMTETCSLPIMSPLVGERRLAAMGRVVVGYESRIVNDEGLECDTGEAGELIVRGVPGRSIMRGYLDDPESTAEAIREQPSGAWLYSGDTAYRDADDFVYFVDRAKDLIKRGGENISSTEVESVLLSMPGVQDASVLGVPDPVRDESVVAVIVPKSPDALSAEDVRRHCEDNLAPFKVPQVHKVRRPATTHERRQDPEEYHSRRDTRDGGVVVESNSGEQGPRGASISLERRIEWVDTDAAGRYHYATAFRLVEAAETSLMARLGLEDIFPRMPRAHLEADFKRMVEFRDPIEVNLEVVSVGNSSVSYEFELLHEGELCVNGKLVAVLVDPDGRPTRWSDEHRKLLMPDDK